MPLYHWMLRILHENKMEMLRLVQSSAGRQCRDCILVRPTLLTDGAVRGLDQIRAGWEFGNRMRLEKGVNGNRDLILDGLMGGGMLGSGCFREL